MEITVYRIVEEALDNINPRSTDGRITIRLMQTPSSLLLEIESPQGAHDNPDGLHRRDSRFTGIHERVMEHRGSVHFTSTPSGTLISVTLPLQPHAPRSVADKRSPLLQKIAS